MKKLKTALFAAVMLPMISSYALAQNTQYRDAREQLPEAFLGFWEADLEASTFSGNTPRRALRTFQMTEGGKVLVTFATWNDSGALSMGHWAAQVDGTEGIEYHIRAGSIPYNTVRLTMVDDSNLELSVLRHEVESLGATYHISEDAEVLTYAYDETTIVYRRASVQ